MNENIENIFQEHKISSLSEAVSIYFEYRDK